MSHRFIHVAFNWSGEPKISEIKPVFDMASDWLRYAPNCRIVWTSGDPAKWYLTWEQPITCSFAP